MIGIAVGAVLEHIHYGGVLPDALVIAELGRRFGAWAWGLRRTPSRRERADEELRRRLERMGPHGA